MCRAFRHKVCYEGETADPKRHPIAIALGPQDDVDDALVTKKETLIRRGKEWFRYDAPDRRLFKQLQKILIRRLGPCQKGRPRVRGELSYTARPISLPGCNSARSETRAARHIFARSCF